MNRLAKHPRPVAGFGSTAGRFDPGFVRIVPVVQPGLDPVRVVLRARVSDAVAPGVLYSPKGAWLGTSGSGRTINPLIDADLRTGIFDGACYNEAFVDISPLPDHKFGSD